MNVWTYWAGTKPKWIDTCLKSIERCCKESKFHLLTPGNLKSHLIPGGRWRELPPGVGTDYLRSWLLANFGGLWIDADTVCIEDPIRLIKDRHLPSQFLYSRWDDQRAIAGYVYSPRQNAVARAWLDINDSILTYAHTIGWGDIGERALSLALRGSTEDTAWQIPLETFLPIDIDRNVKRYFERSGWRDFATQNTIAFGLNYSWMSHNKKDLMDAEPHPGGCMFHKLLYDAEQANAK